MNTWDYLLAYDPWILEVAIVLLGLCVGSFLNVCIYRMPRGLSVVWPGSFCPKSGTPLRWWENIPVVSFLMLAGKGRVSGQKISWQYPAVEILTGLLFWVIYRAYAETPAVAAAYMIMTAIFIAGAFIDWQFKIIPDTLTVGGAFAGLVCAFAAPGLFGFGEGAWSATAGFASLTQSATGMLIGSAIVLWVALLAEMVMRKEAMGFGDVKLMGMIGAFLGWQGALFALFGGAFVGMGVVVAMTIVEKLSGKKEKFFGREVPFGPMLNAAALIYLALQTLGIKLEVGLG